MAAVSQLRFLSPIRKPMKPRVRASSPASQEQRLRQPLVRRSNPWIEVVFGFTDALLASPLRRRHVVCVESRELFLPSIAGSLQQPYAPVPAQDRIVVSWRANFLRLAKIFQRAFKQRQHDVWRPPVAQLRFCSPP